MYLDHLGWKSCPEVALDTVGNTKKSDDVMRKLGARTEDCVVNFREKVLKIDAAANRDYLRKNPT